MPDLVQTMFALRQPPWHGKGTVIQEAATAAEALTLAGLDWEIELCDVEVRPPGCTNTVRLFDYQATVRTDTQEVLGIVGNSYTPIQNHQLFDVLAPVVEEGACIYHTGGVIRGGEYVWLLAKLPADLYVPGVPDDVIENYILVASNHTGDMAFTAMPTHIRVVCNNTLSIALRGHQSKILIRHTTNAEHNIALAHQALGLTTRHASTLGKLFGRMAQVQVKEKALNWFLRKLLPSKPERDGEPTAQVTVNKRVRIIQLFDELDRNNLEGMQGSVYALYNAVVEYFDHDYPAREGVDRLQRNWFGTGVAAKQRAFVLLMRMMEDGWRPK